MQVDLVPKNRKALACLLDQVVIVVKTTCHGRFLFAPGEVSILLTKESMQLQENGNWSYVSI